MQFSKALLPLLATSLLVACGGGGGGGGGGFAGGGIAGAEAALARVDPVYAVEPTLPDPSDEVGDSLNAGDGASGIAVRWNFLQPGARFVPIKLSLNADRTVLTLNIDGQVFVLDSTAEPEEFGGPDAYGGRYGVELSEVGLGTTTPSVGLMHTFNDGLFTFERSTSLTSFTSIDGRYGIATPLDRLPSSATYEGKLNLIAIIEGFEAPAVGGLNSDFEMMVDFSGNTISGSATGDLTLAGPGSPIEVAGDISGAENDGGLAATIMFADGDTNLVSVTLAGQTYGWDAEDVSGAAIGTYLPTGDTMVGIWERW